MKRVPEAEIDWAKTHLGRCRLGRFMSRIDRRDPSGCWIWTGVINNQGYGSYCARPCAYFAHRVMFELWYGVLFPELDHLCKNTRCVNPEHLEPVTHRENVWRSDALSGIAARATHCIHGHPWDEENTRIVKNGPKAGSRRCRACDREAARRRGHPERKRRRA